VLADGVQASAADVAEAWKDLHSEYAPPAPPAHGGGTAPPSPARGATPHSPASAESSAVDSDDEQSIVSELSVSSRSATPSHDAARRTATFSAAVCGAAERVDQKQKFIEFTVRAVPAQMWQG
jgi:hypothetical protein